MDIRINERIIDKMFWAWSNPKNIIQGTFSFFFFAFSKLTNKFQQKPKKKIWIGNCWNNQPNEQIEINALLFKFFSLDFKFYLHRKNNKKRFFSFAFIRSINCSKIEGTLRGMTHTTFFFANDWNLLQIKP